MRILVEFSTGEIGGGESLIQDYSLFCLMFEGGLVCTL